MTRLFDRWLRQGPSDVPDSIKSMPVFDVSNVARYYYSGTSQEEWSVLHDFPNIAPPYKRFWMEYRMPDKLVSEVTGTRRLDNLSFHGVCALWIVKPLAEDGSNRLGWEASVVLWTDVGKHLPLKLIGKIVFPITSQGEWGSIDGKSIMSYIQPTAEVVQNIAHSLGIVPPVTGSLKDAPEAVQETALAVFVTSLHPMLLSLAFLHCKNVTTTVERPPEWQQKATIKKYSRPLVTYHTLNIEPMKTVLKIEGDVEANGLKKALHICRGHFKTFTSEKPLFGRVTGTFWWQSQVRGSSEMGVSVKDYNVKTPKLLPQDEL